MNYTDFVSRRMGFASRRIRRMRRNILEHELSELSELNELNESRIYFLTLCLFVSLTFKEHELSEIVHELFHEFLSHAEWDGIRRNILEYLPPC